jgi:hypothetical protein
VEPGIPVLVLNAPDVETAAEAFKVAVQLVSSRDCALVYIAGADDAAAAQASGEVDDLITIGDEGSVGAPGLHLWR